MAQSTFNFIVQDAVATGGGGGGGNQGSVPSTDEKATQQGILATLQKQARTSLGLQFSVAAILKQSQIFTGFIGSLFQILGAFVDVALMSVFPLLKTSLKVLMKFFDPIKTVAEGVGSIVDAVMMVFGAIGRGYEKIRDIIGTVIDYIPGLGGDDTASRGVGVGAGGLAAAATKGLTAGNLKGVGKVAPGLGLALGGYGMFKGFEEEGVVGLIKETVNFALGGIFGAGGFALGTATTGVGGVPGAIGGIAIYDLLVKDLTQSVLDSILGGGNDKQTEARTYQTTPLGEQ